MLATKTLVNMHNPEIAFQPDTENQKIKAPSSKKVQRQSTQIEKNKLSKLLSLQTYPLSFTPKSISQFFIFCSSKLDTTNSCPISADLNLDGFSTLLQ